MRLTAPLILASASPRRKELLGMLPWAFTIQAADIDESRQEGEKPAEYVLRLAEQKAQAVVSLTAEPCWVLGADTVVVAGQQILGKPQDQADALAMLGLLSGGCHQVMTAVALCRGEQVYSLLCQTEVTFRPLSEQEMLAYWQSGEPADKAGAYGIQGLGGRFVQRINGSYHNVVGLPLCETESLIKRVCCAELGS